jgi:hypothetical protein
MSSYLTNEFQQKRRQIYNKIIKTLDRNIPTNYNKAILGCFYTNHSLMASVRVFHNTGCGFIDYISTDKNSVPVVSDLTDLCEELYHLMSKAESKWNSFTFIRESNGLFKVKFGYEKINSVDHLFLLNWRSKYFIA